MGYLVADFPVNSGDLLPEQPKICSMIEWTLAPSFIANGIVIMIFRINKMTSVLSILSKINNSFRSSSIYDHLLQP